MSVATELQNYNDGLLDAYDAVSAKGGTIPAQKNLANLPDAIDSISGGGSTVNPYITFSTESGTNNLKLAKKLNGLNLEYSYDTTTWSTWDLTTPLEFGGATKLYMRGTNATLATSGSNYTQFAFSNNTVLVDCSGRINKLLKYDDEAYDYTVTADYCFYYLFRDCKALKTAPELSAVGLRSYCYANMFKDCTSLIAAPELPSTTLVSGCYGNMFSGCTSLTTAPELPATTLVNTCYSNMFSGCTSLTTAPELPATTLASNCYNSMFNGCTNLTYVKCLAEYSLANCTNWLNNVSATGTFVKKTGVTWDSGSSGIPTGWTVEEV